MLIFGGDLSYITDSGDIGLGIIVHANRFLKVFFGFEIAEVSGLHCDGLEAVWWASVVDVVLGIHATHYLWLGGNPRKVFDHEVKLSTGPVGQQHLSCLCRNVYHLHGLLVATSQVKGNGSVDGNLLAVGGHQSLVHLYKLVLVYPELVERVSFHDAHHHARVTYGGEFCLRYSGGCLWRPDVDIVVGAAVDRGAQRC